MPFPIEMIMATKGIRAELGFSEIEEDLIRGDYSNLEKGQLVTSIILLSKKQQLIHFLERITTHLSDRPA